jgi:hypothetical protein
MQQFGRRFARSPDDDALTSLSVAEMKRSGKTLPTVYRFVISRHEDHWVVSVVDIEALRSGEVRRIGSTYHVTERDGGRVLYEEPGI